MEKPKILSGKGNEYSEIAKSTEAQLQNWLDASGLTEQEFLEELSTGDFQLTLNKEKNKAVIYIHQGANLIIQPLVWLKETDILFSHFKVDAGLLLMAVASKCSSQTAKNKIKAFVRGNLRVK